MTTFAETIEPRSLPPATDANAGHGALTEFERRRAVPIEGHVIRVVSPEDLVLSKLVVWAKPSHSEMQMRDVRNLIASVPALD